MSNFIFLDQLTVLFNNIEVGKLKIVDDIVYFQYHKDWIKNGFSISPFKLPLKEQVFIFNKNNLPIWGVFIDCLPDGWGIRLNIKKCSKKGINYEKLNILEKLSLTDKTGLGGLDFIPTNKIDEKNSTTISSIVEDVMKNYHDINNLKLIDEIHQLANSSGGARPKIHYKDENNDDWIIKLPMSKDDIDVGKKEYEANILAQKCGIKINECKLIKIDSGIELFAAKRFDIDQNKNKLHTISIAGLLDIDFRWSSLDYKTIFEIISLISVDKENDFYDFFSRMVFNYKFGNCDDHTKNTSFIYDNKLKGYKLSPCYDTTETLELKFHSLLCNNKEKPNNEDFISIAKEMKLDIENCKQIIDKVEKVLKKI